MTEHNYANESAAMVGNLDGGTPPVSTDGQVVLRLSGVDKSYPGVRALKNVSLAVRRGEVHALVGENGAGKSTLVGIASGAIPADSGTIEIAGSTGTSPTPEWCREQGLAIVYQEPALLPDLTVAENLRLGMTAALRPSPGQQVEWAAEMLRPWNSVASIDPRTPVRELEPDARFVVEIARALAERPKIVILDEPTEHLRAPAVAELFRLISALVKDGGAVVYISHRLNEVKQIANTVSVLRDGALVGTFAGTEVSEQDVVNLVVGRQFEGGLARGHTSTAEPGEVLLTVSDFSGNRFEGTALTVRAGEIVGFGGVEGQGQREVLRALGGLERNHGTVTLGGRLVRTSTPTAAQRGGIVYLSHDRHNEAILPGLNLRENASLSAIKRFAQVGVISRARERSAVAEQFAALRVKAPSAESDIVILSGGNQQKVMLTRVLLTGASLILADEPTQGVDVGAREEIYGILRRAAADGAAVIVLSSSTAELDQLCDRVFVFSRGKIATELTGDDISEHGIARAALTATDSRTATDSVSRRVTLARRLARSDLTPAGVLATVTVLLGVVGVIHSSFYLTSRNFGLVLPLLAVLAFYAIGQQIVMMVGGIDLSVGPLGGLLVVVGSFVLAAYRSPAGMAVGVAVLILVAGLVGAVNWFLTTVARINPLIATLVTYTAIQGVAYSLRPLPAGTIDPNFLNAVASQLGFFPVMLIIAIVLAASLEVVLRRSILGIRLRAVGSRQQTAERVGVRGRRVLLAAYVGCSVLVVPAALLLMVQSGTGNSGIGDSYTLASIGAAVLGGASIFGGRGSFVGAVIGAVLVIQIDTVTQFLGLQPYWQEWLLGGLTVVAAAFYSKYRAMAERSRP